MTKKSAEPFVQRGGSCCAQFGGSARIGVTNRGVAAK